MGPSNSSPFFYLDSCPSQGEEVEITGDEAIHILRARRVSQGQCISLTDGLGSVIEARITSATPKRNKLTAVVESVEVFKKNRIQRVLASAIPKGDRQSIMLDMIT